jgi:trimeric autotransporter adhesin
MRIATFGFATFLIACMNAHAAEAVHQYSVQKPAAPQVTVGSEIKQLRFDWSRSPRAQFYKLLKNPDGHSGFTQVGRDIKRSRTTAVDNIAVHLHDWKDARYIVAACNARGCTNSPEISTPHLMLDAIGYIKSEQPKFADFFGERISLSENGRTLAVRSRDESGTVWIFRRDSKGSWTQEDLPLLEVRQPGSEFGFSLQLSADGRTLAVGALRFNVPGGPTQTFCDSQGGGCVEWGAHGAVHVFRRSHNGSWAQEAFLHAPQLRVGQTFGLDLALSGDGKTLAVGSLAGSGDETEHYLLRRTGSGWQNVAVIRPVQHEGRCFDPALSGDGSSLFLGCDVNDPDNQTRTGQEIQLRKRSGSDWPLIARLPYSIPRSESFEFAYSVDRTGRILAIREWVADVTTVSIYTRAGVNSNSWMLQARLNEAAPNTPFPVFGRNNVVLSGDGRTLVVGDFDESSGGAGVLEGPEPAGVRSGGAYVFRRSGEIWNLKSLVKASNPDSGDGFGVPLAVSGTGNTIAISARGESSAATGINGEQSDNSLPAAGAVYLY